MERAETKAESGRAEPSGIEDLRLRLRGSQKQERAARAEARRLARELALARRLLHFSYRGETRERIAPQPAAAVAREIPRRRATLLTGKMVFAVDSCRNDGTHTAIIGWAFLPVSGWDGSVSTATLLFRHGNETFAAAAGKFARPDVAAHFATQPLEAVGGARSLAGAGFACEILNDSLPAGVDLEIVLRLECGELACERATGQQLRF